MSSRIRLARNLVGRPFPERAGERLCEEIWEQLRSQLTALEVLRPCMAAGGEKLAPLHRQILVERHLASREFAMRSRGSGLVVRTDHTLSVMVNEEDHLRLQALGRGLCLEEVWSRMIALDEAVEECVPIAFSERWGYLTACPTNVGSGLRASVMLHLPGLGLLEEMSQVVRGVQMIGMAVRGLWGEGTEAVGHMYQISNQVTLGEREEVLIGRLNMVVRELIEHERNARRRLLKTREVALRDHVGRALGILANAHLLNAREALAHLSALRLGLETGILETPEHVEVDRMLLWVQPGHVQFMAGRQLDGRERDEFRASLIRGWLNPPHRRRKTTKK
ncbi:MAG: protein arginine kinase [Kiritimatiellae bacterium]|nr:protein arginine kinase [Kiritimatiellia bacterium]